MAVAVKYTPERDQWDGKHVFGGPMGAVGIMAFSHFIMYYFWICVEFYGGNCVYPGHELVKDGMSELLGKITEHAAPTAYAGFWFTIFLIYEFALAVVCPGPIAQGLAIPSENDRRVQYKCNAISAWYIMIITVAVLHLTEIFPLYMLRQHYGAFMTWGVIYGNLFSILVYVHGFVAKRTFRMTGNHIYDFFMGSQLNPEIMGVDLKLFFELRNSWVLLMMISVSCASQMYQELGYITGNMWFLLFAHGLYSNACQKGEECVPTTWDIFHEKFGWMLIYWNTAGVPFFYTFQSMYIQSVMKDRSYSTFTITIMFILLCIAYYIFDTANSQKNRFRMKRNGVPDDLIKRKAFPQFPWGYIENPRTIKGENGKELFVDGWYRYGSKIHYSSDIVNVFLQCFSVGEFGIIPYFYWVFFTTFCTSRIYRDEEKCAEKYGEMWVKYKALVPYRYIPGIY